MCSRRGLNSRNYSIFITKVGDNMKPIWGERVKDFLSRRTHNPHTRRLYSNALRDWRAFLKENFPRLEPITGNYRDVRNALEDWVFAAEGKSSSVSARLSGVRSFYRYMVYEDLIGKNPAEDVKVWNRDDAQIVQFPDTPLADSFQKNLEKEAENGRLVDRRSILIVRMFREGGFRVSELCSLRVEDFEPLTNKVQVKNGKRNKFRVTAIQPRTSHMLTTLIKEFGMVPADYIFTSTHYYEMTPEERARERKGAKHLRTACIHYMLKSKATKYGYTRDEIKLLQSPHGLRHLWAVEHFRNGTSEIAVMLMGGWESPKMFKHYIGHAHVDIKAVSREPEPSRKVVMS